MIVNTRTPKLYSPSNDSRLKSKDLFRVTKFLERHPEFNSKVVTDFESNGLIFLKFIMRIPAYKDTLNEIDKEWSIMNQIQVEFRDLIDPEHYQRVIENVQMYNKIVSEYSKKIADEALASRKRIDALSKELREKTRFVKNDPIYLTMSMPVECLPYKYQVEVFRSQEQLLRKFNEKQLTREKYRIELNSIVTRVKAKIIENIRDGVGPAVSDFMDEAPGVSEGPSVS